MFRVNIIHLHLFEVHYFIFLLLLNCPLYNAVTKALLFSVNMDMEGRYINVYDEKNYTIYCKKCAKVCTTAQ